MPFFNKQNHKAYRTVEIYLYALSGGMNDLSDKLWYAKITVFWLMMLVAW